MLVFDINVYLLSKVWGELFDLAVIQNESSELTQLCDTIVHAGRRRGKGMEGREEERGRRKGGEEGGRKGGGGEGRGGWEGEKERDKREGG